MIEDRYSIVGTSHVSFESKQRIKKEFANFQPDIIAVELDRARLQGLLRKEKTSLNPSAIFKIGFLGYLFAVIGKLVQNKVGKMTGMQAGEEMLLGVNLAKNNKLILALIDQDIQITLKNLSKKTKIRERFKILKDILFSKSKKIKIDVSKIPTDEVILKLTEELRLEYPGMYSALIEDRNKYMAKKAFGLLNQFPDKKVLIIIGAGHKEGLEKHLKTLIESNLTRN